MKEGGAGLLYMRESRKGTTKQFAAARAGMSERTARKYERAGKLPSQLKRPRTWRTRPNPFEEDWPWVVEQLERDPALQATTLFALLCAQHPDRYRPTQDRTLRRHYGMQPTWNTTGVAHENGDVEPSHHRAERGRGAGAT